MEREERKVSGGSGKGGREILVQYVLKWNLKAHRSIA